MTANSEILEPHDSELFSLLHAYSPVGIFLTDHKGRNIYSNPRLREIVGYAFDESLGDRWREFVHPADRSRVTSEWFAATREERRFEAEFRVGRIGEPNDQIKWIHVQASPRHDIDGRLLGHVGVVDDITARKRADGERERLLVAHTHMAIDSRYETLFQSSFDAILVADEFGRFIDANRAATKLLGYERDEFLTLGVTDVTTRAQDRVDVEYTHLVDVGEWRGTSELRRKDETLVSVEVRSAEATTPTNTVYFAAFRDLSEMQQREVRRERQLRDLVRALIPIISTIGLEQVLQAIVDQARFVIGSHQAVVGLSVDDSWSQSITATSFSDKYANWRTYDALPNGSGIYRLVCETNQPMRLTQAELELHPAWREFGWTKQEQPPLQGWLAVPLISRSGANIGLLQLSDKEEGEFDADDEAILVQLARLASVAVENVRLHEESCSALQARDSALSLLEQRLISMVDISAGFTFDQPLRVALDALAANIVSANRAAACSVRLLESDQLSYRVIGSAGLAEGFGPAVDAAVKAGADLWVVRAVRDRQAVVMRDLHQMINADPRCEALREVVRDAMWDVVISIPLSYRDGVLGTLSAYYPASWELTDDEVVFLGAVANQTAMAIETSRLFTEAQSEAALDERQRLSRELHDSLSQVLYGIGLGATAIRDWLETDPQQAIEPTDFVLAQVESGIAEMRALIFELRAESLEQEGLVAALDKQASALQARYGLTVEMSLGTEPNVPLEMKQALYRVGQEAMNNTARHAQASRVRLELELTDDRLSLKIEDNGLGFDPTATFPGHVGLRSMRERVERLGGALSIEGARGSGTRIKAEIPIRT